MAPTTPINPVTTDINPVAGTSAVSMEGMEMGAGMAGAGAGTPLGWYSSLTGAISPFAARAWISQPRLGRGLAEHHVYHNATPCIPEAWPSTMYTTILHHVYQRLGRAPGEGAGGGGCQVRMLDGAEECKMGG